MPPVEIHWSGIGTDQNISGHSHQCRQDTLDRLPDTAGRRSFVLPRRRSNTMDKSREELEKEYAEATAKLEQYQHRGQR